MTVLREGSTRVAPDAFDAKVQDIEGSLEGLWQTDRDREIRRAEARPRKYQAEKSIQTPVPQDTVDVHALSLVSIAQL